MALNQYQFQFGSFLFGGAGSPYQIESVDGLESLPDIRAQDDTQGYNDGMFSGRDFYGGRTITMAVNTFAGGGNSAFQNFNLLQAALLPQQTGTTNMQFLLSVNDIQVQIGARVRARKTVVDPEYTFGYIKSVITFFCPDPRYYDATLSSGSFTVNSGALGRTYNRVYNLLYGGGSLVNTVTVTNNGWVNTYPVITITGPAVSPVIGNLTTGASLTVNVSLTNTDTLVIDLSQKLITLNGVSARNLLAGNSTWFGAAPGASTFFFTGSGLVPGTTAATITYRSAFV